jgi:drug/metabolite transporter (DMT)-like permease
MISANGKFAVRLGKPYRQQVESGLLSIVLACIGYSVLNVSQAVQKIGLRRYREHAVRGTLIWISATLASLASFGIVFAAIALGRVSIVGALAGTGLVALALFGWLVMGETLPPLRISAILAIVAGAAVVALGDGGGSTELRPVLLWGLVVGGIGIGTTCWLILPEGQSLGLTVAAFSGFLGAYSQLFQKLSSTTIGIGADNREPTISVVASFLSDPYTIVWVSLSLASTVILQFAYRHAEATQIVPAFTAAFIATPVVGGVVVFSETLTIVQWIAIGVIIGATWLLASRRRSS